MRENASLQSRTQWPDYLEWLITTLEDFNRVFRNRVRSLSDNWDDPDQECELDDL